MSTTLPHGIIQINEGNIAWYGDITANWQLIDSKIGEYDAAIASIPAPANNGTLTINYGGTTLAMFGADDAGNVTADIPAPGDGTLTIKVNGATAGTFTANQSTAATANITVPVNTSDLVNDSGYLTASSNLDASRLTSGTVDIARLPQGALERLVKVANEAARYALTTADVQLGDTVQQLDTGIMYIVTDADHLDSAAGYTEYTAGTAASVPWSGVTGKPTFAAVATSGAYSDLTGTPTIPTVNNGTLTIQQNGTTVDTFTANSSSDKTVNIQCVDLTNNQTVGGVKKFSDGLFASKSGQGDLATLEDSSINSTNEDANGMPLAGHTISFKIKGSQVNVIPCMLSGALFTSGNTTASLRVYKYKDTSKRADIQIMYVYATDRAEAQFNNCHITTNASGVYDIGSSTNKWKDVNTVLLNGKTPAYSTDIPTKVSQLTNDSGFITSENALPIGSYIQFAGSQAPEGFLVCNGGEISRTTYSQLFAVIGTTYGSGNGSTTFNLPNLTDRFLQGSTTSGTVKDAGLPNISGSVQFHGAGTGTNLGSTDGCFAGKRERNSYYSGTQTSGSSSYDAFDFFASRSSAIYGNSDTVQPPALTCLICIKY